MGQGQKRGYTSLNGVVTATSALDSHTMHQLFEKSQQQTRMRQAIFVIFLHKLSTDEYPQQGFCPIGEKIHGDLKRLKHQ
ncbi:hypothetical protein TNCV_1514541, partial [Trichonephila clavipes]